MKAGKPHAWIALFSGLAVLGLAVVDVGRSAPGELTAVHQRVPDLAGRMGCASCHGGWTQSMTESCLECHVEIADQLAGGSGLHGTLEAGEGGRCARCHSEHHGASFQMVNVQSFVLTGIPAREDYDHARIGFEMRGKHLELACAECHLNADVELLPEGQYRFLGLEQDCRGCHDDPHGGRMQLACVDCHDQETFEDRHFAEHDRWLRLVGGHAEVDCRRCHAEGRPHALENLGGRDAPRARQCQDCHDSPHAAGFVSGNAELAALAERASCVACHVDEHTSFREEGLELDREQHARSGFPLDAPHADVGCAECHDPAAGRFDERYPGRDADACHACHADPHDGQFADSRWDSGPFAGRTCLACHERHAFDPPRFDVEAHRRTALPLTGSHVETDCGACHLAPPEGGARVFAGTPTECAACHSDAHGGFFGAALAADAAPEAAPGACGQCHLTTTFSELPPEGFDHAGRARFPVQGAHAQTTCEACHPRSELPDDHGRTFGRVAEHFGPLEGCVTCHADPHRGGFDAPSLPAAVDGRQGCARCHVETSFRALPHGFDHGRWTGFALDGAHAEAACSACHAPLGAPDALGRTGEHARGSACADCHADPHAGQFAERGATNCQSCHRSTVSFQKTSFNHAIQSRFVLGDAHERLACSACHVPVDIGGRKVVRYRPLGRECADCHGSNVEPLRRPRGGRR